MTSDLSDFDLVIAGVGGQGAVKVSDIIGKAAVSEGMDVRAAETHGMAQRGGSVVNYVRLGCELGSLIPCGSAHGMLALEPVESMRYIHDVAKDKIVVMNTSPIYPITVTSGQCTYPDPQEIVARLERDYRVVAFDAVALARQAGNMKTLNVVMLGAISSYLPIPEETLVECIRNMVPPRTIDTNLKAFRLGRETTRQ